MKERFLGVTLAALTTLVGAVPARAACTVTVTPVAFGTYNVFNPAPVDTTGRVVYVCDQQDHGIRITLTPGSSGTYLPRTMRHGSDMLQYNLYIWNMSTVWGDGTAGTSYYFIHNPPNRRLVDLTVYGRIPAGQDVRPGTYTDTIQVQIDF